MQQDRTYYEQQLLDAEAEYRADRTRSEISRRKRNNAIRTAVYEGGLHQIDVAKLIGLHRARIGQIILKSPPEDENA